ncbi:MAG: hypothetical protein AB7P23_02310 [Amphiplicatus sp.]
MMSMTEDRSSNLLVTLYRTRGSETEFRYVDARIDAGAGRGATVEQFWERDCAVGVRLASEAKDRLLIALLEERFKGRSADELEALLDECGIAYEWRSWNA